MKLKLDENGHVVVVDGKPVYTHDDGKDVPFDAKASVDKITALNGESMRHRVAKEEAETKLKAFEGIENPEDAKKALDIVKNLDAGQLKTVAQVEEIKENARKAAESQVAAAAKANGEKVQTLEQQLAALSKEYDNEKITNAFSTSNFIKEKANWPADAIQAIFGSRLKREDGKLVAYDMSGNKVFSRARPGEVADFDEALEMMIDSYPHRDQVLKGTGSTGSGARPGGAGGNGGSKTMTRSEFSKLTPQAQSETARSGTTIVD